jgi:hypothetical protein
MNVFYSEHLLSNLIVLHKLGHICTVPRFRVVENLKDRENMSKGFLIQFPPIFESFWKVSSLRSFVLLVIAACRGR